MWKTLGDWKNKATIIANELVTVDDDDEDAD